MRQCMRARSTTVHIVTGEQTASLVLQLDPDHSLPQQKMLLCVLHDAVHRAPLMVPLLAQQSYYLDLLSCRYFKRNI